MRILLASALYAPYAVGGAERVVKDLAEGLALRGHELLVLTTAPEGVRRQAKVDGIAVEYLPVRNVYRPFQAGRNPSGLAKLVFHALDSWNPLMVPYVSKVLRRFRPGVMNSHNITGLSPSLFSAARRVGVPVVHTLHDQYFLCPKTTMFAGDNCARRCASCEPYGRLRSAAAVVDKVVGVSQFILDQHARFGAFGSVSRQVIRNAAPKVSLAAPRPIDQPLRFGFLGQLRETKGLHVLVDAFLAANLSGSELHIAGKGDEHYAAALQARTSGRSDIRWLGHVDSAIFLQSIDILVVPSLWNDTAPLVILEAFARGRPVAGSRRGGITEFLSEYTGWSFDPSSPEALRDVLRQCHRERERLPDMGRAASIVADAHSRSRFLDAYEAAFVSVATRN